MNQSKTFETTYTRYPFAPLVALGIAVAEALKSAGNAVQPAERKTAGVISPNRELAA